MLGVSKLLEYVSKGRRSRIYALAMSMSYSQSISLTDH